MKGVCLLPISPPKDAVIQAGAESLSLGRTEAGDSLQPTAGSFVQRHCVWPWVNFGHHGVFPLPFINCLINCFTSSSFH